MIAGHDDLRPGQRIQKAPRFPELRRFRTLGEIAGDHDEMGLQRLDRAAQRIEQRAIDAPEVQVGEVDEGAHRVSPLAFAARHDHAQPARPDAIRERRVHDSHFAVCRNVQASVSRLDVDRLRRG